MANIDQIIRNNNVELVNRLLVDDNMCSHLVQNRIFSQPNQEAIMSHAISHRRNTEFLRILGSRGNRALPVFIEALRRTNQLDMVEIFEPVKKPSSHGMSTPSQPQDTGYHGHVNESIDSTPVVENSSLLGVEFEPEDKHNPTVTHHPVPCSEPNSIAIIPMDEEPMEELPPHLYPFMNSNTVENVAVPTENFRDLTLEESYPLDNDMPLTRLAGLRIDTAAAMAERHAPEVNSPISPGAAAAIAAVEERIMIDDELPEQKNPLQIQNCFERNIPVDLARLPQTHGTLTAMKYGQQDVYRVNPGEKGIALIINVKRAPGRKSWAGATPDADNLRVVFKSLGFTVLYEENPTAQSMKSLLYNVKSSPALQRADAFIMCVMAHGNEERILGSDGSEVNIQTDLLKPLYADSCPALAGKPKALIVHAYRQDQTVDTLPRISGSLTEADDGTQMDGGEFRLDGDAQWQETRAVVHPEQDFLVCLATLQGYVSYGEVCGSWFIRSLVIELHNHSHEEHLEEVFTRVRQAIADCPKYALHIRRGQFFHFPHTQSTLRKKFYLCISD